MIWVEGVGIFMEHGAYWEDLGGCGGGTEQREH